MSVMAERYASSQILQIWSRETKILKERELWILIMKAQRKLGVKIPSVAISDYEKVKYQVNLSRIDKRERQLKHDVKARIEEFNFLSGHQFIHIGLTSRDITENIEGWQIKRSMEHTLSCSTDLLAEFIMKIEQFADLTIVGRTHNVPAQLTTLGRRIAHWCEEFLHSLENLENVLSKYPIRGIKGAIGTAADLKTVVGAGWKEIDESVKHSLNAKFTLISPSQIYPRSLDFHVISNLFQLAAPLSTLATNVRLMAGIGWLTEGQSEKQVGSSAMPHKKNPRLSERVNGFFNVLRGYLVMASGISGNQWNEGDVSESVVRRTTLSESFYVIDSMLRTSTKILREFQVDLMSIKNEVNLEIENLLSSRVLLLAVSRGLGREEAHKLISNCSKKVKEAKESKSEGLFDIIAGTKELKVKSKDLEKIKLEILATQGEAVSQSREVIRKAKRTLRRLNQIQTVNLDEVRN